MKKRVRIYKPADQWRAQMGGYQATEAAAPQAQLTDEDLINATVKMLAQGSQPQEVLNSLVENGIEQQKATEAVKYSVDYIKNIQDSEYEDVNADANAQQQAALEEAAAERQAVEAQEAEARKARMQEMYGLTEDNTTQDYSDDEQAMMDMMRYGGLPSKRTFVKNAVKLAKKQMGGQEQQMPQNNRADNTDTGDRQAKLQKFVGSLQNHANEALMKEDAEAAYNQMQMMQQQMPFMPMAQEGGEQPAAELNPRQQRQMARQQRQMGRQMNRMIGNIPVGLYNNRAGGLPTNIGVINMPAIGTAGLQSLMSGAAGLQNYLPAMGSIPGGPKLANIDVRKTGLFGRPKQYSITFAQDVVTNPTTAENAVKQEIKNVEEEAKDVTEKVETAAEDVKKADEATKAAEETATKSTSGTKTSTGAKKTTTATSKKSSASASTNTLPSSASYTNEELQAEMTRVNQKFLNSSNLDRLDMMQQLVSSPDFQTNPYLQAIYKDWYTQSGLQLPIKDELPGVETQTGMNWLDQNYKNSGVKSVSDVLNSRTIPASQSTTPAVKSITPTTIPAVTRKIGMVELTPRTQKQELYPSTGVFAAFQQGGFTQQGSGLYKFVYGGNDMYEPPIPGKITDDPYFQYGGLKRYAEGDEVTTDTESTTDETTAAKTPDYSINRLTGKPWTESDWEMVNNLLGNAAKQAATSTNTSSEDTETTDSQATGYNYGYNTGVGPIYPPLFGGGRGRGLQNLLSLTPFGANPLVSYAGTWAQQKGLPIDPATGQPYTGAFANPQIAKIDVRKSGLFGRPKKYSIDYMVDDAAGTSSFLSPEDYPGGVNPGATGTVPLPGTTAATNTSDGLAIDPETGEPLPVGSEIKNLKLKSFMSKIPGVRQLINWGDAPEMTPEEEADFKYKSEIQRNMAAEERGDIEAPPIPEDETTAPTPAQQNPMLLQKMQMQQNIADEQSGDMEVPLPPGERTTRTADERSFDVERRMQPMMEGLPTGTPEEVRSQLAQQQALSPSSFAEYQAGPMQNVDASVAEQFGVPQSMVDQFAYQNTMGDSGFDLSTQQGFDRQQYLNESLGREQLDVSQRPTPGSLTPYTAEQINTGYTTPNIIQNAQSQAEFDRVTSELIKQGLPVNQQNIMQQVAKDQTEAQIKQQQAIAAEQKRIAAQKAAKQKTTASTKAGTSNSKTGTSEIKSMKDLKTAFNNFDYDQKNEYMNYLIDLREGSSDKAYRKEVQKIIDDLDPILTKEVDKRLDDNSSEKAYQDKYKQIKDEYNFMASGLEIDDYLKLQKSGKLPTYKGRDYYRDLSQRTSRQYGGMSNTPYNLYRAQYGVTTPVISDPRFGSYADMMKNMADEEAGLMQAPPIPGETEPVRNPSGMKQIEFGDVQGVRENAAASDRMFGTNYTEDYGLNKPGRKKVRVNYKNKNMWTIDPLVGVETALAGAKGLTRFLNTRDERKREKELAQSLTSDSVYGSRSAKDKGTYDPNSGLFRPNEMGANIVAKYGGTSFKEGGTTYMSAAQVKKFLEEGGELEFV